MTGSVRRQPAPRPARPQRFRLCRLSGRTQSITPYTVEFRLVSTGPQALPFTNHATEVLDFNAGEVKLTGTPRGIATYANWHRIEFHH
jgi:hypothetical protein